MASPAIPRQTTTHALFVVAVNPVGSHENNHS